MGKIAIITARGGSKRIPRKNIRLFLGKPMVAYSIEAALQSGIFDEVMVSTDDEEIARIAIQAGASVPFMRSDKTSNDFATTSDVVMEVLEEYGKRGRQFEYFCCIYPTAPFVTPERLREGMMMLEEKEADCVMPVVSFSFPPQRCVVIRDGKLEPKWPQNMPKRSQDLEPYYHDCGQFYCVDVKRFQFEKVILMPNTLPLIVPELEVQDIDNEVDWKLAELKYKLVREENGKI